MDYEQLSKITPLIAAIQNSNVTGVQAALDNGADINFRIAFDENKTALHHAVAAGDPKIVDLLLQNGADPTVKSKDGKMPIELIADNTRKSIIEAVFKKHGWGVKPLPSPNSAPSVPATTYSKRKGTTSIRGQLYETKLLALVLFRALHRDDITSFNLATNVDDAGAFDDIVMRYTVNGTDKCIYLQAKHKECKETNFKDMIDGSSEKGDFSLLKYFKSYLALKIPKLQCDTKSVDDEFLIFTNIGIKWTIPEDIDLTFHDREVDLFRTIRKGKSIYLNGSLKILKEATIKWYYDSLAVILAKQFVCSNQGTSLREFIKSFLGSSDSNLNSFELLLWCNSKIKHEIPRSGRDLFEKVKLEIFELLQKKTFPRVELTDADCCCLVTDFFDKLCFYTNQPNENEVEEMLKSEILSLYPQAGDISVLFHLYHNAVQKWWLQTGQVPYQTKDSVLFANARSDIQRNSWLKNLHDISMNKMQMFDVDFDLDKIGKEYQEQIDNFMKNEIALLHVVSNNQALSCLKLLQYLTSRSYNFSYINSEIINLAEFCSKLATDINCVILNSNRKNDKKIIESLQKHVLKIIFISEVDPKGKTRSFKDLNKGLVDLSSKSQEKLLNRKVFFQGTPVSLCTLLGENLNLVDEQILHNLMMEDVVEVAPGTQSTFHSEEMTFYVERTLTRCLLRSDILNEDLFTVVNRRIAYEIPDNGKDIIIVGMSESVLKTNTGIVDGKVNGWMFEEAQCYFDQVCRKYQKRNIHLLQLVTSNTKSIHFLSVFSIMDSMQTSSLQWERSQNSIEKIYEYSYQGDVEIELNYLTGIDNKLVILAAEPGMGKSTYLTALTAKTKQHNPSIWIIRINLLDFSKTFDEWQQNNVKVTDDNAFSFLESAVFNESSGMENSKKSLGKNIFFNQCKLRKPILLLDGFDEISPDYKETVVSLVNIFRHKFVSSTWIATRSFPFKKQLEQIFNTFACILQPFNDSNSIEFLRKYWISKSKGSNADDKKFSNFIEYIQNCLVSLDFEFIRIPLQLKMFADIYKEQFETIIESTNNKSEFTFGAIDILLLYEKFIKMTFVRLQRDKNKVDLTKPSIGKILKNDFSATIVKYKILAMYTLFHERELISVLSDQERTNADLFLREIRNGEEKTGFILQNTHKVCLFVHQTYAEYFCALFTFDKYATLEFNSASFKRFINIFLLQVLSRNESYTIMKFMKLIIKTRHYEIKSRYSKCIILLQILLGDFDVVKQNTVLRSFFMYMVEHSIDEINVQLKAVILQAQECNKSDVLNEACQLGCIKLVKLIIDLSDLSMIRHDCFALHEAACYGHADIVAFLLEKKYEVDSLSSPSSLVNGIMDVLGTDHFHMSSHKGTPLHVAAAMGHTKVVKVLLANGANINSKTTHGVTTLDIAVANSLLDPMKILYENGIKINSRVLEEVTPWHTASSLCNVELIELLLKHGAVFNVFDTMFEFSPLILVCKIGNIKIAKVLLENGACANSSAKESGETALFFAVRNGHYEIVDLLLANGALVNFISKNGMTPLMEASGFGNMNILKLLLNNAADCNIYTDEHKFTALEIAIIKGHVEVARFLTEYGAKVNIDYTKNKQPSPLHLAAALGNREMVEMLLNKGAKINSCEKNDFRPIHMASLYGHANVVDLLLKKGARVDERTNIVLSHH